MQEIEVKQWSGELKALHGRIAPRFCRAEPPLQQSTGIADKRKAQQVLETIKVERWEQDKLGAKPRRTWEEATVKFLEETVH